MQNNYEHGTVLLLGRVVYINITNVSWSSIEEVIDATSKFSPILEESSSSGSTI